MAEEDSDAPVSALIFDTNILIWYMRRHATAAAFVAGFPLAERNVSVVSYLELLFGCRNRTELRGAQEFVTEAFAEVVPITESISRSAVRLMQQFVLSRRPELTDALIAATALSRGEAVATANLKHFEFVPGLTVKQFRP